MVNDGRRCAAADGGDGQAVALAAVPGSKEGKGGAHRVQEVTVKLEAVLVWRGALWF